MAVYKHKGKWMYDFQKNGVRHREGGFETKVDAQLAEAKAKKSVAKINTDFIKLCESRLEDLEIRRSRIHFLENKRLFEKLTVLWGAKKKIQREDVETYLNGVAKKSPNNANKHLRLIKALFNHGIEREIWNYNPVLKIKPYPISKKRKYIPPKEDLEKIIEAANGLDKLYLLLVKNTLARIGEINQLKWEDVFDDHLILKTHKARNSDLKERRIYFNKELAKAINELPRNGEYVFINPRTETRYIYRRRLMKALCKKAKVKEFGFHAIRHYGASLLANRGASLTDIQELLGHEEISTTGIYLQSIGVSLKTTVNLLEDNPPPEAPTKQS